MIKSKFIVNKPLPVDVAENILLNLGCHVDHEGFDLNEIEQHYYKCNGVELYHDNTWYKDGGQTKGTNGVLYKWINKIESVNELIVDHSHLVFKYPITGDAANQIKQYIAVRPELKRLLSTTFKCGLDLCIDYLGKDKVEPIVHIEWDYDNITDLLENKLYIETLLNNINWDDFVNIILRYNSLAKKNKITAFEQADFRSMLVFGKKSYYLIPTL